MNKWNIPLTYQPKIQPVIDGKIRQTIRAGNKFCEGDLIRFYVWHERPYHSKRTTITEYTPIIEVLPLKLFLRGISFPSSLGGDDYAEWRDLDHLAEMDGIVPATGEELKNVLYSKNNIPIEGIEAQIIRW